MPYVEFPPRPDLADIVKCIWNYEAAADETSVRLERIVPDGNPELVVHYGEPFFETTSGRLSVTELARDASLSTRQLERRFIAQVGIAPGDYANIVRFRAVFDLLATGVRAHLALAADAGYFDQSHLSRDFRRFLGCSPATFLSQLRGLSDVLVGAEEETPCRVVTRRT